MRQVIKACFWVTSLLYRLALSDRAGPSPAIEPSGMLSDDPCASEGLRRELALAIEHIESIRVLLEISGDHRQPAPRVALANLDLVLKHLRNAGKQLDLDTQMTVHVPAVKAPG